MWALFIDDLRSLSDVDLSRALTRNWKIARNSQEAIALVQELGLPNFISFDHDLGEDDTSMKFLRWIEYQTDYIQNGHPPRYQVHSANPVGKDNIISFMETWKKIKSMDS